MTTSGHFYVYEHWRPDRDECFYVGKGHGRRANDMSRSRNLYHRAIQKKLSALGLAVEVKIIAGGLSEAEAFKLERERIAFWRADGSDLANFTDGGEGVSGIPMSEEQKKKISIANKGKLVSWETREKISLANKGKVISQETRQKISQKNKEMSAAFKGRSHTEQTKKKLSVLAKIRGAPKHSADVIEKIAAKHRGMKRSKETCEKISAAAKARGPSPLIGRESPLKGRSISIETKQKMSDAKRLYWAKKREDVGQ